MGFDVDMLRYKVCCPDPQYLAEYTASSPFETPEKVRAVLGDLRFPAPSSQRPYLFGCMVLSFDGKMGFADNPEGTLISKYNLADPRGAKIDFWMLNVCRCYADAVILGTGTLQARMDKLWFADISDPELLAARPALGRKTPYPLSVISSLDGKDIPFKHMIFQMRDAPLIMTSLSGAAYIQSRLDRPSEVITEPRELCRSDSSVRILAAGEKTADMDALLRLLRQSGISYVSVEAPGYIWALIQNGRLDEYLLNYSGVMAGGNTALGCGAPFSLEHHPHVKLLSVGYTDGFLFTRQKLIYNFESGDSL